MAEYIEREALVKSVEEYSETAQIQAATRRTGKTLWYGIYGGVNYCRNLVLEAPAADVVEVVHGEWVLTNTECAEMTCSRCGFTYYGEFDYECMSNYCPNCGAKMDGERKDNNVQENEKL